MSDLKLTKIRIKEGVWYGELLVDAAKGSAPSIEVRHLDHVLDDVAIEADPDASGRFAIRAPIPAALLSDGVQTFVISDAGSGEKLDSFTIVTGQPMEDDIRAEVNLLREELDMLKRAFRRHCVETM